MTDGATVSDYYGDPAVQRQLAAACGDEREGASCVFLSAIHSAAEARRGWLAAPRLPPEELPALMRAEAELGRSAWDQRNLLLHLDLDYVNLDHPEEVWRHPVESFFKLEATASATRHVLRDYGLHSTVLMASRGYSVASRIPLADPVVDLLAELAPETPSWWPSVSARQPAWSTACMDERTARADAGLSLIVEFLAQQILRRAAATSPVPVTVDGAGCRRGLHGRECVSLALSRHAMPLDLRVIRLGFSLSNHHRHTRRAEHAPSRGAHGHEPDRTAAEPDSPDPVVVLPRHNESTWHIFLSGRGPAAGLRLAQHPPAAIPQAGAGLRRAIRTYADSPLAQAHREFYAVPALDSLDFRRAFHAFDATAIPPCVAESLDLPAPHGPESVRLQHAVRYFLLEGWHPRTVAGLLQVRRSAHAGQVSKELAGDTRTGVEHGVRVFAGLLATGLDDGTGFECASARDRGLCPSHACGGDPRVSRERVLTPSA